jgi:alanine racemase
VINRLGLPLEALGDAAIARLDIDVVHSHLASAEDESAQNEAQRLRWDQARGTVRHRRASLANSAGIALGAPYHGGLTRPGLSLYGGVPCAALAPHIRQVVRPEAALIQIRQLQTGDAVGYNATFVATQPMRVGVVSLGYADGYLRCWSGRGTMRAGSQTLPVLGRVSMDMTVVDLTAAPELKEGDWLSIDYALPEAAAASGLSQYELLTLLGRRFAR